MTYRPYPDPVRARHQLDRHRCTQTVTITPALEPLAQAFAKLREVAEERRARGESGLFPPRVHPAVAAGAPSRLAQALTAFGEAMSAPIPRRPARPVGSEETNP